MSVGPSEESIRHMLRHRATTLRSPSPAVDPSNIEAIWSGIASTAERARRRERVYKPLAAAMGTLVVAGVIIIATALAKDHHQYSQELPNSSNSRFLASCTDPHRFSVDLTQPGYGMRGMWVSVPISTAQPAAVCLANLWAMPLDSDGPVKAAAIVRFETSNAGSTVQQAAPGGLWALVVVTADVAEVRIAAAGESHRFSKELDPTRDHLITSPTDLQVAALWVGRTSDEAFSIEVTSTDGSVVSHDLHVTKVVLGTPTAPNTDNSGMTTSSGR